MAGRLLFFGSNLGGRCDVVVILEIFEEIADVKKGIAVEANFHECGLHAWQDSSNAAFVDASD
jgi:hypothetical protein